MSLRISTHAAGQIHAHLSRAYPEEGCGVMLGRESGGAREVESAVPLENRREDSRANRYLIAPEQLLAVEKDGRAHGLDVIGFFHSHPDHPSRPSAFDLEHAWPYYSYLIVSVDRGRIADTRSWRLAEDRSGFELEAVDVLPGARAIGSDGESP